MLITVLRFNNGGGFVAGVSHFPVGSHYFLRFKVHQAAGYGGDDHSLVYLAGQSDR